MELKATSKSNLKSGHPTTFHSRTGGGRCLCLLACLWLLSGADLAFTQHAQDSQLMSAHDECNVLAALVMPHGPWALSVYKGLLMLSGTVTLVVYRQSPLTEWVTLGGMIIYALVAYRWIQFYYGFAGYETMASASMSLGGSAVWLFKVTLLTMVAACVLCARSCINARTRR